MSKIEVEEYDGRQAMLGVALVKARERARPADAHECDQKHHYPQCQAAKWFSCYLSTPIGTSMPVCDCSECKNTRAETA